MCGECDYHRLLVEKGVDYTPHRLTVLRTIGDSPRPVSAQDIIEAAGGIKGVNKVTVYRILELLVEKRVVERFSTGGRAFRFGLAPNENHRPHPHFYCTSCGVMECLSPESVGVDVRSLNRQSLGAIDHIEVRLDGICRKCLVLQSSANRDGG